MSNQSVYLDYNSTTPIRPEVIDVMVSVYRDCFGNPSSVHRFGVEARLVVERSRRRIARLLDAPADSIVFTSGGSEANALAIKGMLPPARSRGGNPAHVVVGASEHKAVLEVVQQLEADGDAIVTPVFPDADARYTLDGVAQAMRTETALVCLMLANNEVGTVNAIADLGAMIRDRWPRARFHCDGVQAVGKVPVSFASLGVDTLAVAAHKFHGPKGVGALIVCPGLLLRRQIAGGGQEAGRRAGTENAAAIAGFAEALELAVGELASEAARQTALREYLWHQFRTRLPIGRVIRNSPDIASLPNTLNVSFPGHDGRVLARLLDDAGFAVSAGSACTSSSPEPSHVLLALRHAVPDTEGLRLRAEGTVRISLGRGTTQRDIETFATTVVETVSRMTPRAGSPIPSQSWSTPS